MTNKQEKYWNMMWNKLHDLFGDYVQLHSLYTFARLWEAGEDNYWWYYGGAMWSIRSIIMCLDADAGHKISRKYRRRLQLKRAMESLLSLIKMVRWSEEDTGHTADREYVLRSIAEIAVRL